MEKIIRIKDFTGTFEEDSGEGIREAIKKAAEEGASKVVFEPGRYILKSFIKVTTDAVTHDAGSELKDSKECHISLKNMKNLTLEGAVGEDGEPATILVGFNDMKNHSFLPSILWCEDCINLSLKNIAFTREPVYCSAGVIRDKAENSITVQVFEGNPCYDGMGTYCMNRFNPETGALMGESVTYGFGAEKDWELIAPGMLKLESRKVAEKVQIGEYLSWHQGAQTDFQTYYGRCDDLNINNIRIMNSNGFCMIAENCRNITAEKVVFKPEKNRLFTGPRDAWKLFKCSGSININKMYIEGVRMDGQNMHSNWLFFKEKLSPDEALFFCKYTYAPILEGSLIEFYEGSSAEKLMVKNASGEAAPGGGNYYRIKFSEKIPEFVDENTFCAAQCWEPDRYFCSNSEFVNIAGAGHLVRYDNLTLLNCKYKNTMNPGILLGAELPTHAEGGHATNILIRWCEFDNCGFYPRYGTGGCIGINSSGFKGTHNKNIIISDNEFKNSKLGIHVMDAKDVFIMKNSFINVETQLESDEDTTENIIFDEN